MEGYHHRLRERFINRVTNFWGFMLFMLKETCIMHGTLERMRGGEVMQGRRRAYQRNEDRIQQYKANYLHDHDKISFLMNVVRTLQRNLFIVYLLISILILNI